MKFITIGLASLAALFTSCTLARIVPKPPPCRFDSFYSPTSKSRGRPYYALPQGTDFNLIKERTNQLQTKSWDIKMGARQFTGSIANDGSIQMTVGGETFESETYYIGIQYDDGLRAYFRINGDSNCQSPALAAPGKWDRYVQVKAVQALIEAGLY